ncbi:Flageller protein FlgA [Oceanicola granulosus HTCC2516]|uniref:Flagella basal body P-ring formation protein FlgA n=1 Tax=Oceanicola granulosus (strain ATCC BAA-861 / DSM 15982 / KCTC 12143 / HTCC2516) TaxID=314256 RepID=Q2CGG1_OCEGH|nr:flagellar basal body P-ring formation chaperone FlgA [Oceanicola granulosus]EAR51757.1 Flageller protein FlgA [Oceanicola granulosus HTCC2516]
MLLRALALIAAVLGGPSLAEDLAVLVEERARDQLGATLPDTAEFEVTLREGDAADVLMLAEFWMDGSTGQFVANAVLASGETRRVMGLALATVPVPVPVRRILPDEIIAEADLDVVRLPMGRVGAFAVVDLEALVGMQVRRVLSQGRPVMSQSVIEPLVIERGDAVSIRYSDGALELTAPGRAMAGAHRGQDVRVVNLASNRLVTGIAARDGIVEVLR